MSQSGTTDAAKVAGGSGITFAGILADRGLRWVVTWLLAWRYGEVIQGTYALVTKAVVPLVAVLFSMGLDTGIIYFGAQHRKTGDQERLKGVLLLGGALATGFGLLAAVVLWWMPGWLCALPEGQAATLAGDRIAAAMCGGGPEVATIAGWGAAIVGLWVPLLFLVGALRARKDMKSSALAFQIALPVSLIAGVAVALITDAGLHGVLAAYTAAAAVAVLVAARFCWKHYGALLRDRRVKAKAEPGALMAFSIPQTLAATVFRLNLRMDYIMLGAMVGAGATGFYDVAAGLAVLGALPVNAVITMFNPFIAELVSTGETDRLNALLKTVTRWLILLSLPAYAVLILASDLILTLFPADYAAATTPLIILCAGQIINVACSPTMRLIPMSGHTTLNLINGLVAAALGISLNLLLIPQHGAIGAAVATAVTLSAWGLWRVVEVWHLLRCFPFTLRSAGIGVLTVAGIGGLLLTTRDASIPVRILAIIGLLITYAGVVRAIGIQPEDTDIINRVKTRLARRMGRGG